MKFVTQSHIVVLIKTDYLTSKLFGYQVTVVMYKLIVTKPLSFFDASCLVVFVSGDSVSLTGANFMIGRELFDVAKSAGRRPI